MAPVTLRLSYLDHLLKSNLQHEIFGKASGHRARSEFFDFWFPFSASLCIRRLLWQHCSRAVCALTHKTRMHSWTSTVRFWTLTDLTATFTEHPTASMLKKAASVVLVHKARTTTLVAMECQFPSRTPPTRMATGRWEMRSPSRHPSRSIFSGLSSTSEIIRRISNELEVLLLPSPFLHPSTLAHYSSS